MSRFKLGLMSILFCSLTHNVWGQNELDKTVISNSKIEQEIKTLENDIKVLNDSIGKIVSTIAKDSTSLKTSLQEKQLLEQQMSKESISNLQNAVNSLDSINISLLFQIAELNKGFATRRKTLLDNQAAMDGMGVFSVVQKQNQFDENMLYTKKRFSQMDITKLNVLLDNSNDYSGMKPFNEYVLRLKYSITNKIIYDDGNEAINSSFNEKNIISIRERIIVPLQVKNDNTKQGVYKLADEQFSELDSLDIRLSRYKGGIRLLKNTINELNADEQIMSLRETNNRNNRTQLLNLIKPYIIPQPGTDREKTHQRYFEMIPYLMNMLQQYWNEVKKDPFTFPTKTESDILNTVVE